MELTVKPLRRDVRRGLAAIDLAAMSRMGLMSGEHATVSGPDATARPRVWPAAPEDEGTDVVRLDADHRRRLGVDVGDRVDVTPIDVQEAEAVLVGIPASNDPTEALERSIKTHLVGCVVESGDTVTTPIDDDRSTDGIPIRIAATKPASPVAVVDATAMTLQTYEPETDTRPSYGDVGGLDDALTRVRELVELPLQTPSPFDELGIEPPTGVLLHGPPGTGKTLLAEAVANETDATFVSLSGPEVMSRYYGESEERLRKVFEHAEEESPAVVFVDELDAIAPPRSEASGDVERRVVAQLLTLMDGVDAADDFVVLGATNRLNAIDPALRRGGRFDREVEVGIPSREDRLEVLEIHARGVPLANDVDLDAYASVTHGFVGADLASLVREAAMGAVERVDAGPGNALGAAALDTLEVTDADLQRALDTVDPSALRDVAVEVPDVSWSDVGGLDAVKRELREAVEWPLAHPDVLDEAGLESGQGVLLYGPPGTGKTMLAKAAANESDCNLLSVKGPELLSKWVGESERGVRSLFDRARANAPAIVLFDEIDAIAPQRGGSSGSDVGERVVGQLLTELDGVEPLEDVLVVATSNRPDLVDDALLRPGRLDREIHVSPPDTSAREEIFAYHTANSPVAEDVDFGALARATDGYVGADIAAICRHAAALATREFLDAGETGTLAVSRRHYEAGVDSVDRSVTPSTRAVHESRDGDVSASTHAGFE